MTKTTKRALPVSKTIQFQQHQKIKDISVSGKDALTSVDFSERDGDFKLKVKADPDKVNDVTGTPFVTATVTTADENTDDPKKSVALGHDYQGLNLETAGKYLSINKTKNKAVIDGTLIETDLTKALNDAKEARDKADKAAEKAGLVEQKAATIITDIADVKDLLAKLKAVSETADEKLKAEIDKLKAKLETLPKDAKLYVSESDKNNAQSGRLENLTYVNLYTALDSTDATALSVSENVTITVILKPDTENTNGTAFTREVVEIHFEVAQPALPDFNALSESVEDAKTKATEAKTKADATGTKVDELAKKLEFTPIRPAKALLELSKAKGRTNFTQDDLDAGIIVSGGLFVDMGQYWLPAGKYVSVEFGGNKENAQELLDFNIKTYNTDSAEIETINAKTLLEPGVTLPPIIKTIF